MKVLCLNVAGLMTEALSLERSKKSKMQKMKLQSRWIAIAALTGMTLQSLR